MKVPFTDLKGQTNQIKKQYLEAVRGFLDVGNFILGPEVEKFEKAWAKTIGVKYAVGVSNGADALWLGLTALGIGAGDEVITQGNAYNASVTAILRTGAKPCFVDILEDILTIDVKKLEALINKKTKAIMPVHLYGQSNDMGAIMRIARKYHLFVIEDSAQAHLAKWREKLVGSFGDVGAFSFYPTKNLGAFGDAGAVTTKRKDVYEKILALRNLGQISKNDHEYLGYNMRLDSIQAIVLSLKLKFLRANIQKRQRASAYYDYLIKKYHVPVLPQLRDKRSTHVYHLYVVQVQGFDREMLAHKLRQGGIETAVHYPTPVYHQPFYRGPKDSCPVSDKVSKTILSLPMFPEITKKQQEYVVSLINREFNR